MEFDLVIRGGRVADGTGMPAYTADVAVKNGRIARIGRASGAAKRVIDADGREYFAHGRTEAGGDDVPDENTIFEIGSITKVFTAILLADMIERDEVALANPIKKFLPEKATAPTRGGKSIRLIDLATHRSGHGPWRQGPRPAAPGRSARAGAWAGPHAPEYPWPPLRL